MAKKKHINGIDDFDMDYIDSKMRHDTLSEGLEYLDAYKKQLKTLSYKLDIKCKNQKQKEFLNDLRNKSKEVCFGIGSAGTGKSFISLSYALKELKDQNFSKIIMIVPTAPAGGADLGLGFLKGELDDKTRPYKEADKDTIEKILKISGNGDSKATASALINGGYVKYEFINFILGKTFDNALILVNEAEQYTKDNMKLLLTRIGENSKIIITGDCEQVNRRDIVKGKEGCGLAFVAERLSDMEEVSVTEFNREDIVRNQIITKILDRLD